MAFHVPTSGGGGGTDIIIGSPVVGGNTGGVLFEDGSGNLGNSSAFTFDPSAGLSLGGNLYMGSGSRIQSAVNDGDTLNFAGYDVDGAAPVVFATLTSGNTPTFNLAGSVTLGSSQILSSDNTAEVFNKTFGSASSGNTLSTFIDQDVPTIANQFTGTTISMFDANETIAIGDIVVNDGTGWLLANSNTAAGGQGMLGIAVAGAASGPIQIGMPGTILQSAGFSFTPGAVLYLGTSDGTISENAPSSTDQIVRVIGFATASNQVYFFPSPDYITIV